MTRGAPGTFKLRNAVTVSGRMRSRALARNRQIAGARRRSLCGRIDFLGFLACSCAARCRRERRRATISRARFGYHGDHAAGREPGRGLDPKSPTSPVHPTHGLDVQRVELRFRYLQPNAGLDERPGGCSSWRVRPRVTAAAAEPGGRGGAAGLIASSVSGCQPLRAARFCMWL